MKKTEDLVMHPLWITPVMLLGLVAMIEGLHTSAHLHQRIDADAYCRNNAEWVESQQNDDYY
tara:strand:- start:791 stop:976 length:186 start_codon:yes stop_codon:yes gene_type:complete